VRLARMFFGLGFELLDDRLHDSSLDSPASLLWHTPAS
jgi:hypothetical protein